MVLALIVGAAGAAVFNFSLMPYFLASTYFDNYQFVKDYKQGKITVNKTDQVYIQENTSVQNAIERVKASVVAIQGAGKTVTSGLVITSDGSIITLASKIPAITKVTVYLQGVATDVKVSTTDVPSNLALLKADKQNLQTVPFADASSITLGQNIFLTASTSAAQDHWFANEGIITEISSDAIRTNIIERSAANGAPLFTSAGQLVGLAVVDQSGKVWAIPVSKIQKLLGL